MFNRVIIAFSIIFSATFLFTENRDKIDSSAQNKIMSDNKLMEYDKEKIESMKLMEKNRLIKKMSKNAPSRYKLSKQLNSPAIVEKKDAPFVNDYFLEKLNYMKTHNLHHSNISNNSIANKMSLRGYDNQTNNTFD